MRPSAAGAFCTLAAIGCGSTGGPPPSAGSGPVAIEGVISVTGTAEEIRTMLTSVDSDLHLVGEVEVELRGLEGARVRVLGVPLPGAPARRIDVRSYEILAIDGAVPWVGTVGAEGRGMILTTDLGERFRLAGGVSAPVGSRVWVTGERASDILHVHSYGILRVR